MCHLISDNEKVKKKIPHAHPRLRSKGEPLPLGCANWLGSLPILACLILTLACPGAAGQGSRLKQRLVWLADARFWCILHVGVFDSFILYEHEFIHNFHQE